MQLVPLFPVILGAIFVYARPTVVERGLMLSKPAAPVPEDVLLFDALAFPDPANPANTLVSLQAFVFKHQVDSRALTALENSLKGVTPDIARNLHTVRDRLRLLGAVGLAGRNVKVFVQGCNKQALLPATSGSPHQGIALKNVPIGGCRRGVKELIAQVAGSTHFTATVFCSPNSGFGLISDIDDTIKVSHVLDKVALAKSTLLDAPQAVAGMPELYASLAKSLNSPQFIYISGSPFQLYPFLHKFIHTTYSASKGPILLQNLRNGIRGLADFAGGGGVQRYKISMIERVHQMYPKKKFLAVGDSTQQDPETYAEAFRKFGGNFILCIWIRQVDGADNTAQRFAAAFKGVPVGKYRIFKDAEIPYLRKIDVARGKC
ncbi:putative uncharacterized conserved protein (DUF2183) [Lyophyllum shimeji]|uniref:Uncharacterized conserved protein (DUF2183) n=1 Tax=Lyophyllum shimeji TaxID=47721 RepID=A0A9P3PPR3_LYOSH|nr:putative uncharacterized conserved protein (DUF2183) [Lyophyllum shimeji]